MYFMTLLAFVLFMCTADGTENIRKYKKHKLIRVTPAEDKHIQDLQDIYRLFSKTTEDGVDKIEFWREPGRHRRDVDIRVHDDIANPVEAALQRRGMTTRVIIQDLARSMEKQMEEGASFHEGYHQFDEIREWLVNHATACYPNCRIIHLGNTTEQRPLYMIKISTSDSKPAIFVDAGFHSREWIAPATALYLIEQLIAGLNGENSQAEELLNKYTWFILPLSNPDGYVYTWSDDRMWRKTRSVHDDSGCIGTDMNRNFRFHWGGEGSSDYPCSNIYCGPYPFSEPESRAIANFIWNKRFQLKMYLSFHSYGQYWLTPWGYSDELPDDYNDLTEVAQVGVDLLRADYGFRYQLGTAAQVLYPAAGGSDDWAKGRAGIKYSYTVELPDTGEYGFLLPPERILENGQMMFQALDAVVTSLWDKID